MENQNTDIKNNFAENVAKLRKAAKLTQAEFAEKINYSDKAVSKWERGEAVPDLYTVKAIADFFDVKVDYLIAEPKAEKPRIFGKLTLKRTVLGLASTATVWLIAVLFFAFIRIIVPSFTNTWLAFIYAIPVTAAVLMIFTSVWGKSVGNLIIISVFIWTVILTVYLTIYVSLENPPRNLWEIFLIGIPAQGAAVFWLLYKRVK